MARVSFAEVTKRYDGGQEAVADLNLEIADGELPGPGRPVRQRQEHGAADDRRT